MNLLNCTYEIEPFDPKELLQTIEKAGRVCYKSEDKITDESANQFVKNLMLSGHTSVLEHVQISVKFIIDRKVAEAILAKLEYNKNKIYNNKKKY